MLYPEGHPYHWPVIGYMPDLTAASYDDVVNFFKTYYAPSNASLVVAGDLDPAKARALVEKWFSDVKPGRRRPPMTVPGVALDRRPEENDHRQRAAAAAVPRVAHAGASRTGRRRRSTSWPTSSPGGKNSRLYKRLVYDMQIAQSVSASQNSQALSSYFLIEATPRPGHTVEELQKVIDEEIQKLQREGPTEHELQRSINQIEASFYNRMERSGGFGGKADQLNAYYTNTGDPDWFNEDLSRYRALSTSDIRAAAEKFLPNDRRIELTVRAEQVEARVRS